MDGDMTYLGTILVTVSRRRRLLIIRVSRGQLVHVHEKSRCIHANNDRQSETTKKREKKQQDEATHGTLRPFYMPKLPCAHL